MELVSLTRSLRATAWLVMLAHGINVRLMVEPTDGVEDGGVVDALQERERTGRLGQAEEDEIQPADRVLESLLLIRLHLPHRERAWTVHSRPPLATHL